MLIKEFLKMTYFNNDSDLLFGAFMGEIRCNGVNSKFIYYILDSIIFKEHLNRNLNTSTILLYIVYKLIYHPYQSNTTSSQS